MKKSEQQIINLINEKVTTFNPDYESIKGVVRVDEKNKFPRRKLIWLSSITSFAAILIIVLVVVITQNIPLDPGMDNLAGSGKVEMPTGSDNSQFESSSTFGIISSNTYNQIMANMFASSENTYSYQEITSTSLLSEEDKKTLSTNESYFIIFSIYKEEDVVGLVNASQTTYMYFKSNIKFSEFNIDSSASANESLIISIENGILKVE